MYMEFSRLYRLSSQNAIIVDDIRSTESNSNTSDADPERILTKLNKIHNKDLKADVPGLASEFFSKSNVNIKGQWLTKLVEEITKKLYVLLRFTCCLPLPKKVLIPRTKRRYFVKAKSSTSTEVELNAPITFNCVQITDRSEPVEAKVEKPSDNPMDTIDVVDEESNPDKKGKGGKLKGILKKLKKKPSVTDTEEEITYRCGDKCGGECVPINKKTKANKLLSFLLHDDNFYVSGDAPRKHRRITNFFNDIYTPCNSMFFDGHYSRYCVYHDLCNPKIKGEV